MQSQNIKVYLAISLALTILFILIIIIPFTKKTTNHELPTTNQYPTPTSVETNPSTSPGQVTDDHSIPAEFTGVAEEELPKQAIDLAAQKKDLRQKVPLTLSTFTIDFDYGEDKFVVTLKDPKDQAQREFEKWRTINYPGLSAEQFLLK